jgi:hypothetical protein
MKANKESEPMNHEITGSYSENPSSEKTLAEMVGEGMKIIPSLFSLRGWNVR